jgi:IS6 family transposase
MQRRPSAFWPKPWGGENHSVPRVINTDKDFAYPPAIVQLKAEAVLEENCCHRPLQYLNNVLEQDHRRNAVPIATR